MTASNEPEDHRLTERLRPPPPRQHGDNDDTTDPDGPDDEEIDAVHRLMGFLRGDDS